MRPVYTACANRGGRMSVVMAATAFGISTSSSSTVKYPGLTTVGFEFSGIHSPCFAQ